MHPIFELFSNKALLCALAAWAISQAIKGLICGLWYHEWTVDDFLGSGGMPSSHSAAVTALAMTIGFREGFASSLFAISMLFAIVVMYDAAGVRRETGKQGKIINEMMNTVKTDDLPLIPKELKEKIGHTPLEVIAGFFMGLLCSLLFSLF